MAEVLVLIRKPSKKQERYFGEDTWRPSFLARVKTFKELEATIKLVMDKYYVPKNVIKVYKIPFEKDKPIEVAYQVILTRMDGSKHLGKRHYLGWIY